MRSRDREGPIFKDDSHRKLLRNCWETSSSLDAPLELFIFCRATPSAQTVLPQMADLCMIKSGRSSKRRVGATARVERDNRGSPFFVRERLREEVLPALSVLGGLFCTIHRACGRPWSRYSAGGRMLRMRINFLVASDGHKVNAETASWQGKKMRPVVNARQCEACESSVAAPGHRP